MTQPLVDNAGLGVYVAKSQNQSWEYVGFLTNEKPSDILKIPPHYVNNADVDKSLVIGLSLQKLDELQNLESGGEAKQTQYISKTVDLCRRIGEDLYNFILSFAQTDPNSGAMLIPGDI